MDAETRSIIETRSDTTARLKKVLIEGLNLNLEPDEIAEDAPLFGMGLGLDSIDALQLIVAVEEEFKTTLPPDNVSLYRSINTLADHLIERQREAETR